MLVVIKNTHTMRGGLCGKRATVLHGRPSIVDRTPPVIDPIARYSSRIAIFAYPPAFDRSTPPLDPVGILL